MRYGCESKDGVACAPGKLARGVQGSAARKPPKNTANAKAKAKAKAKAQGKAKASSGGSGASAPSKGGVASAPSKGATKAKGKGKAKAKSKGKAAPADAIRFTTNRRPPAPLGSSAKPPSTVLWKGCKVQTSWSKRAYRLFIPDNARVDKAVGWKDGHQGAWKTVCELIEAAKLQ